MSQGLEDTDYLLLQDPNLPPEELQRIASTRFDLDPLVLEHPNAYPELTAWILQSQRTELNWPGFSSDRFSCQPVGDRSVSVSA